MERSGALVLRLLRLGLPIAVGRLGVVGMGVVDTIVVGRFAPGQLAHQALGWTITGPALLGGIGLLLGVQVLVAQAMGAGEAERCGAVWRRGLVIALIAGLAVCLVVWSGAGGLLRAFGVEPVLARRGAVVGAILSLSVPLHLAFMATTKFLEALERPTPGAAIMWAANGVNLALNLALVPSGGAIGSAWATVLSRLFLIGAILAYVLATPSVRRLALGKAPGAGYRPLLAIGSAAALSALVEAGAFASMSVIAAREGAAIDVAAWVIATGSLVTLAFLLAQGFATAGVVLVSEAVGAGSSGLARRIGWTAVALTVASMVVCGLGVIAFAPQVAAAFTTDAALRALLASEMALVALLMIPDGGQGATEAVLRARGDNWFPTATRLTAYVAVAPPLALWFARLHERSVTGVLEATTLASLAALAVMLGRLAVLDRLRPSPRHQRPPPGRS